MDDFGEDGGGFAPMADGGDDPFADDQAGDPFAAGGDGEAADPFADGVEGGAVDPFAEGGTTDAFGEEAVEQADPFAAAGASMPMSSGAGEDDTEAQQALLRCVQRPLPPPSAPPVPDARAAQWSGRRKSSSAPFH